jgi:acyl-CoA synthetase (AMP-forming)/AMP-acid ligase II
VNTVGRALPVWNVNCRPETGLDLPDNCDGEFVARGYNIMKGYYKMPEATAAAIDKVWVAAYGRSRPQGCQRQLQKYRAYQGYDHPRR